MSTAPTLRKRPKADVIPSLVQASIEGHRDHPGARPSSPAAPQSIVSSSIANHASIHGSISARSRSGSSPGQRRRIRPRRYYIEATLSLSDYNDMLVYLLGTGVSFNTFAKQRLFAPLRTRPTGPCLTVLSAHDVGYRRACETLLHTHQVLMQTLATLDSLVWSHGGLDASDIILCKELALALSLVIECKALNRTCGHE